MKKTLSKYTKAFLPKILCLLCLTVFSAFGDLESINSFYFLNIETAGSASSMGKASSSARATIEGVYHNPASIASLNRDLYALVSFNPYVANLNLYAIAAAFKLPYTKFNIGASLSGVLYPDIFFGITGADDKGSEVDLGTFALRFTGGAPIRTKNWIWDFGGSIQIAHETLDDSAINAFSADVGFIATLTGKIPKSDLSFSFYAKNLGFGGATGLIDGDYVKMPISLFAGIGYEVNFNELIYFKVLADFEARPTDIIFKGNFGAELGLFNVAMVRAGYVLGSFDDASDGFTTGVGFKYAFTNGLALQADYALVSRGVLGWQQSVQVGMGYTFDASLAYGSFEEGDAAAIVSIYADRILDVSEFEGYEMKGASEALIADKDFDLTPQVVSAKKAIMGKYAKNFPFELVVDSERPMLKNRKYQVIGEDTSLAMGSNFFSSPEGYMLLSLFGDRESIFELFKVLPFMDNLLVVKLDYKLKRLSITNQKGVAKIVASINLSAKDRDGKTVYFRYYTAESDHAMEFKIGSTLDRTTTLALCDEATLNVIEELGGGQMARLSASSIDETISNYALEVEMNGIQDDPAKEMERGKSLYGRKQYKQSITRFRVAALLYEKMISYSQAAESLNWAARGYEDLGSYTKGEEMYRKAIDMYNQALDNVGVGVTYRRLGDMFLRWDNKVEQARESYVTSLSNLEQTENTNETYAVLSRLRDSYTPEAGKTATDSVEEWRKYLEYGLKMLPIVEAGEDAVAKARIYRELAYAYIMFGRGSGSKEAAEYGVKFGQRSYDIYMEKRDMREASGVMNVMAEGYGVIDGEDNKERLYDARQKALELMKQANEEASQ